MTMQTLFENFEGLSQILKEQSGKILYLGVFTYLIAKIKNIEKRGIYRKIWVST